MTRIAGVHIHGLTAGIIGTGQISACSAAIAAGLGCRVLAFTQHASLYALIHAPEVFKAGVVASAPTDWRYKETGW